MLLFALEISARSLSPRSLIAFTRALGGESVDHGVRVIGVNPGRILTERQIDHIQDRAEKDLGERGRWKEILAKMSETLPFKRTGDPAEVSDLVCYLASAYASRRNDRSPFDGTQDERSC